MTVLSKSVGESFIVNKYFKILYINILWVLQHVCVSEQMIRNCAYKRSTVCQVDTALTNIPRKTKTCMTVSSCQKFNVLAVGMSV